MNKSQPNCWIGAVLMMLLMTVTLPARAPQSQPPPAGNDFSDQVATRLLEQLRVGLESGSQDDMLAAFDREKMPNYNAFRDQLREFFNKYQDIRVHYRIAQTWTRDGRGIVLTDFEMEAAPTSGGVPPVHRQAQIRFEFERGRKGWKIVDLDPRGFFS